MSPRREGATLGRLGPRPSRGQHGRRGGGRGAASPGRSGAGPPSAEPARRRGTDGTRMEALRLELRGGGLDARARRTRRQLCNSGVLRGGKLSNAGREKLGGGCREAREPRPSAIAASGAASSFAASGPRPLPASLPDPAPRFPRDEALGRGSLGVRVTVPSWVGTVSEKGRLERAPTTAGLSRRRRLAPRCLWVRTQHPFEGISLTQKIQDSIQQIFPR